MAALFVLLAVACSKEEYADIPMDGEQQEIRFDIAVATAMPSNSSSRVSTPTDYTCSFTAGDQVGLYIVKGDGELQANGNWVENALMTFDGSKWTCDLPADKKYYPRDGSKLSFYAYYPYNAQVTNPLAMSFSVQSDQSAGLSPSYLMTASRKGVPKSHNPVQLTFSHKLALVKVNLKNGDEPKDIAPRPADVVTLKGMQLTTTLDDWMASGSGDSTDVKMHYNKDEKCWYALVPPQMVGSGSVLLTFEWTSITTLNHKTGQIFILSSGKVNQFDITIDVNMTPDPHHVYAVGDSYPYVGFNKQGVVFEVSNGGKSGKIISLKRENGHVWSTENVVTGASNEYNGRVNMEIIRKINSDFSKYPAFKWVHGKNSPNTIYLEDSKETWYLPARLELKTTLYAEGNKEKVAQTLEALGLENPFLEDTSAWCSTEKATYEQRRACITELSMGGAYNAFKSEQHLNWPIMAF